MVEVDLVVGDVSAEETFVLQRYSVSFQSVRVYVCVCVCVCVHGIKIMCFFLLFVCSVMHSIATPLPSFPQCSGAQCRVPSPTVPLLLQTAVTFIETSQPPSLVLDSTSDVVRKLPSDFLYPFISGSSSTAVTETVARTLLITSVLCVLSFL